MMMLEAIDKFTEWRKYKVGKFTLKGYDRYLKDFCVYLRNPEIEIQQITPEDVVSWMTLLEKVGFSVNSFIPTAEALKQFFRFYRRMGYDVVDPELIVVPRKEYYKPRVATEEEYSKLLEVADELEEHHRKRKYLPDIVSVQRNRAMMMMLWDTGARLGEILAIQTADLDFKNKKVVIRTEKSRGRRPLREIFWSDKTNVALEAYIEGRTKYGLRIPLDTKALFVALKGWCIGRPIGNTTSHNFLKQWSLQAGLSRVVNAHSFRHHKGHDIIQKGGSGVDVMNILGHANITSSQVYVMMHDKELGDRARKFMD